jgi:alpha-1,2-mannosyltransferase
MVALLAGLGTLSYNRAARERFDFRHSYLDARYVWEHRALNPQLLEGKPPEDLPVEVRQLPFYLPTVPLLIAPLTAWGRPTAALLWAVAQIAALGLSLRMLRSWSPGRPLIFGAMLLLALPALVEAARFNQLSYFVLALVLGGLVLLERNRAWLGGALFGCAAVIKLLPGLFLIWLILKRKWTAVGGFVVAAAGLAALPPVAVFGPRATLEYHREWCAHNLAGDAARGLLNPLLAEHFVDHRNQSIAQVLARLTWPGHPHPAAWQPVQLGPDTCMHAAHGAALALLLLLAWSTRRSWHQLGLERRRVEFAVFALGMLVFSPLLRQYYLVWALPAVLLLVRHADAKRWWGRVGTAIWVLGMLAWTWPAARVVGANLLMLLAMGVLLLSGVPEGRDQPAAESVKSVSSGRQPSRTDRR